VAKLSRISDGALIRQFNTTGKIVPVWTSAMSKKGDAVATGHSDGNVRVWEKETGKLLRTFKADTWGLFTLEFSTDDRFLISGGEEYTTIHTYPNGTAFDKEPRRVVRGKPTGGLTISDVPNNTSGAAISEKLGLFVRASREVVEVFGTPAFRTSTPSTLSGDLLGHSAGPPRWWCDPAISPMLVDLSISPGTFRTRV
jgi:WD40 repeat protein